MRLSFLTFISIVLISTVFISCKPDPDINLDFPNLHIKFSHFVDNDALSFDTILYTNAVGNKYSVATLKYFVSNIILKKKDGSQESYDGPHYIDASDESTYTINGGPIFISSGEYTSITFVFGLTEAENVTGAFVNPPESNMEWPIPLGGGYHYMKLEGKFDSASIVKNYQAHLGRHLTTPHFINITHDNLGLTLIGGDEKTIECKMNINNWWSTPNTLDLNIMSGIMQNETIQEQLEQNGSDIFTFEVK
jgi:hypothetical protein